MWYTSETFFDFINEKIEPENNTNKQPEEKIILKNEIKEENKISKVKNEINVNKIETKEKKN